MSNFREQFAFWWEQYPGEFWFDLTGKLSHWWWRYQEHRRAKNPELVELDAFRGLLELERRLEEWPRAIPLLEQALKLYDITRQHNKREAIRKRLKEVDPTNPKVQEYFKVEKRQTRNDVALKINAMTGSQKSDLDQARALVNETGRCSTAMLQRRMGIGYNHATELIEILRSESLETMGDNVNI